MCPDVLGMRGGLPQCRSNADDREMRRFAVACAVGLLFTGCGQNSQPTGKNQQSVTEKSEASAQDADSSRGSSAGSSAGSNGSVNAEAPSAGPANKAVPGFVGLWATSQAKCRSNPWRFTSHELSVKGGPSCTFYQITKMPGGYDLAAQCPDKKPIPTDLIKVRFAQSAGAMLVESNALPPTGLVSCAN